MTYNITLTDTGGYCLRCTDSYTSQILGMFDTHAEAKKRAIEHYKALSCGMCNND